MYGLFRLDIFCFN